MDDNTKIEVGSEMVTESIVKPEWFDKYSESLHKNNKDLVKEINELAELSLEDISKRIGGNVQELPYKVLQTLFIDGSDNPAVADFLREERRKYLLNHPEEQIGKGASEGVITYDGRFISKADWDSATESEKRAIMVGSTCFHYNSDTPGMGSSVNDRW